MVFSCMIINILGYIETKDNVYLNAMFGWFCALMWLLNSYYLENQIKKL